MTEPTPGSVLVCGLHGPGPRIVEQLRAVGETVVVLDREPDPVVTRRLTAQGVTVRHCDAAERGTLESAGLADATAVVCVEADDLRNLQLTLLVRDRRPDVRLVTALGNAAVGRAVRDSGGPGAVLDAASLATPSLVEACLDSPVHELDVAGTRFLAATVRAGRAGTLRALYGDLVPLGVTSGGDDRETVVCPGRDLHVDAGARVVLLGTPDELSALPEAAALIADEPVGRRVAGRSADLLRPLTLRVRRAAAVVRQSLSEAGRGLRIALVALAGLLALSTLIIRFGYQRPPEMGWVDSLYFTVESVATVGFGDYSFSDQALWLRFWAIFLMLAGVATTAVPLAFLTDMLISRRLASTAGRRRAAWSSGHVVVAGLGRVGAAVVAELRARGRDVVVVEHGGRFLDRAAALDVPVVLGDATSEEVLRAARADRASAIAVLTSDDMVNIETGLAARDLLGDRWADVPVLLRVADRDLGRSVAGRFGFRFVRSAADLAAPWFVGAALGLDVLGTFGVTQTAFLLARLDVAPGSGLDGLAMGELSASTRVVALRRNGSARLEHPPRRDTRFGAGDEAFLVGPYEELLGVLSHHRARVPAD